ncbi:MAG TPA: mycofactocin biosynthesis peptidyl-dipeptidase MftE [Ilumatobacteraceae bacterium]
MTAQPLLIPVGSYEQHGPHLPADTDTRIAEHIARSCAATIGAISVGPTVSIAASGEHHGFAHTLSIGVAVLESVLVEIGRSADWADGIVFVNGHGGNVIALRRAVALLVTEGRRAMAWSPSIPGGDAHAGRTETSMMLAMAPELVRLDVAAAGRTEPLATLIDDIVAGGVAAVSPNRVLGDPAGASAAEGAQILAALVADLGQRISAWRA